MKIIGILMKEEARPDILEQELIENLFDIGHVKFRDYINIISEFFDEIVISDCLLDRLLIKDIVMEQVKSCLGAIRRYAAGDGTSVELEKLRIEAWKEFDKQEGIDKAVLRVILVGLYDEESAQYDDEDSAPNFEIIFSTLSDVEHGLCKRFSEFLMNNLLMRHYKI